MLTYFYIWVLLWTYFSFGPDTPNAPGCSKYYPMEEGINFEITVYDQNNNPNALLAYNVVLTNENTAVFMTELQNPEGELIAISEYGMSCNGDGVEIDFNAMMSVELIKQCDGKPMKMRGKNIHLPNNLEIGQKLPDAQMETSSSVKNDSLNLSIKMINRKVEGMDTLITSVGTFKCVVVSYETEFKSGGNKIHYSKEWLAEGVGLVKSEEYDADGKLISRSMLTDFHK
ncbi:hypothetical protein [Zhouia amylolytica]|uniref:TapB family protein n=1 Tax=Zhouia amylolytica TaxID=376730 RepID=UPI0020CB96A5|nr:hypothetical protein [Zhouia amylolytica]MCQ0112520.1 hypothetical protein [Zhouia amylolytica]